MTYETEILEKAERRLDYLAFLLWEADNKWVEGSGKEKEQKLEQSARSWKKQYWAVLDAFAAIGLEIMPMSISRRAARHNEGPGRITVSPISTTWNMTPMPPIENPGKPFFVLYIGKSDAFIGYETRWGFSQEGILEELSGRGKLPVGTILVQMFDLANKINWNTYEPTFGMSWEKK